MASLDLFCDIQNRRLVTDAFSTTAAQLASFYVGDSGIRCNVFLLTPAVNAALGRPFEFVTPSGKTARIALGDIDELPTGGTFHVIDPETEATSGTLANGARYYISDFNSGDDFTNVGAGSNATGIIFTASGTTPTTWTNGSTLVQIADAIAYNESAANIQTVIRAKLLTNYSAATVSGDAGGPWTIDRVTNGEVDPLQGIGTLLTPDSFVGVSQLRTGSSSFSQRQRIRLLQRPAAYLSTSTAIDTPTITVSTLQAGSATANEIQRISLPRAAYGGTWALTNTTLGASNNTTASTGPIPFGKSREEIEDAINDAFTAIVGANNDVTVTIVDDWTIDIEFTGTNVDKVNIAASTAVSSLQVPVGLTGILNLNTTGAVNLIGTSESVATTFSIKLTEDSADTTIVQESATLVNDLIDEETIGATDFPGYAGLDRIADYSTGAISATGTTEIDSSTGRLITNRQYAVTDPAGAYTHKIVLEVTPAPITGAIANINIEIVASTDPTIDIRDASDSGTQLLIVTGNASAATYAFAQCVFNGTAWELQNWKF